MADVQAVRSQRVSKTSPSCTPIERDVPTVEEYAQTGILPSGDGLYGKGIVEEYAQTGILPSVDAIMKIQTGLLGI
jgi:hypothetical protein